MLSAIAVLSDLLQFTSPISRLAVSALLFTQTRWLHTCDVNSCREQWII